MRNMACTTVGNLGISVHNALAPTDEEWGEMVRLVKTVDLNKFRGISFSDGGAPNSAQRRVMNDAVNGRVPPTAVVTSSALARGVVTAMGWFNPNMKAFTPLQIDHALRHLTVSESEFTIIKMKVRALSTMLGGPPLMCIPKDL